MIKKSVYVKKALEKMLQVVIVKNVRLGIKVKIRNKIWIKKNVFSATAPMNTKTKRVNHPANNVIMGTSTLNILNVILKVALVVSI